MAISSRSYGSTAGVVALTRVYLRGQSAFNSTTRPTLTEVEGMIDRASGVLNLALAAAGFTVPVSQTDAKLACDDWVISQAAAYVQASNPASAGSMREENPRTITFARMHKEAEAFVKNNSAGFAHLGVGQARNDAGAVIFTAETVQKDRSDPDDTGLEQPKFKRGQFDA